jgi:hypothetical protein
MSEKGTVKVDNNKYDQEAISEQKKSHKWFIRYLELLNDRDQWQNMASRLANAAQKHEHDSVKSCDTCRLITEFARMQRRA